MLQKPHTLLLFVCVFFSENDNIQIKKISKELVSLSCNLRTVLTKVTLIKNMMKNAAFVNLYRIQANKQNIGPDSKMQEHNATRMFGEFFCWILIVVVRPSECNLVKQLSAKLSITSFKTYPELANSLTERVMLIAHCFCLNIV